MSSYSYNDYLKNQAQITPGYKTVNGISMYYELHGSGDRPLVLIHGGGSTIYTSFSKILPMLAAKRKVIAVELQAHGHTQDRDAPLTFEQDADDVAALMQALDVRNADFFGFSNGASTAMQIAIRHPQLAHKLVLASGFYKRSGMFDVFWDFMKSTGPEGMPKQLQEAYLAVSPTPENLMHMSAKCANRMLNFKDWSDDVLRSIKAPSFIISAAEDVMMPEHAVEMYRLIPDAKLAILPGLHGEYMGEITVDKGSVVPELVVAMVEEFLEG
jgi:pimeloyl-ACP methyl ester carboxylesterase